MTFPHAVSVGKPNVRAVTKARENVDYQIRVSHELVDPAWDAFLAKTPGGQYVQSSLWAQVKAVNGWRVERIIATQQGRIVAGAQLLLRPLPLIGTIGYVPRGPMFTVDDSELVDSVMNALIGSVNRQRCQVMSVQPPSGGEQFADQLSRWNFRLSSRRVAPMHTLLLDLRQEDDEILARMNRRTRYNARLGTRKGLTVRQGTVDDLSTYYRLLTMTSQRQNFEISSEEYYAKLWQVFEPPGHMALLLAEYKEEVVSAQLAIPFGNTVINKMTVWSGLHGNLKPNEALLWAAIQWSKAQGYDYYDFGGMSSKGANAILRGEELPAHMKKSVTSFKLGFGGDVFVFPQAYMYIGNPVLRWIYARRGVDFEDSTVVKRIMHWLRTR